MVGLNFHWVKNIIKLNRFKNDVISHWAIIMLHSKWAVTSKCCHINYCCVSLFDVVDIVTLVGLSIWDGHKLSENLVDP
jgi:hypothetical protein